MPVSISSCPLYDTPSIVPPISKFPSIPDAALISPENFASFASTLPSVVTLNFSPTCISPPSILMFLAITFPEAVTENFASSLAFNEYPPATPPPAQKAYVPLGDNPV